VRAWTGLVENIGGQIEKVTKIAEAKRLAELKAQLDQNQITTTTELENLQINWIEGGKIGKEGTAAYRRAVGEILASRPLQADTISGLTTKYFQPGLDHAKTQDKLAFETAQKITTQNTDIMAKQVQLDLITETAGLANQAFDSPERTQGHMDSINAKIAAIYARTDIDELTKSKIVADSMDPILKSANVGVQVKSELGLKQLGANTLANYINTNSSRVVSGDLSQSQFDNDTNTIRRNHNLPEQNTTQPDKDLKRVIENMQNGQTLEDLRTKGVINQAKLVTGNRLYVAGLASQFYLDPTALAQLKEDDPTLDKNAIAAIKLAKEGIEFFRVDHVRYNDERAAANEAILKIQQGDYKSAIDQINKAGVDNTSNSLAASLRNLGLGMPNQAPGQVGVTQEQLDMQQAASNQVQQSIMDRLKVKETAYNRRAQEFADVGIFYRKEESQKFLKTMQPQIKAYNDEIAAIKMKSVQQLQVPGQSANFNGGSLGVQVPLTKRSFRGVQGVAMPFPVGAANDMPDAGGAGSGGFFGDYRSPTRNHAGVDFPVSVGTPLLSLVYGTVSEVQRSPGAGKHYGNAVAVKGDDGKEYFYAHMDKSTVALGQRVGPGEKLGYSGETGAPGAPHLHLEISVGGKQVDPLQVLSTQNFGQQPKGIRTGGNPNLGGENQVAIDPRAIPMGNNTYLLDGKMVKFNPDFSNSKALGTGGASGAGTPVKDMTVIALRTDIQDIKIKAGLEPVGYTALPVTKASPPGTPVGYYTLRNAQGGLLTQTAFLKKGATQMLTTYGIDGKTYKTPAAPRPETPLPAQAAPSADPSKAGRVLMQKTGQVDAQGLDIIAVTLYNKQGGVAGSYTVNSGKPGTQRADTSVAGTYAPAPYGNYDIGAPEAANDIASMRSDFIPVTPKFNTQRSLLGFHFDGNRATDPGSEGCIVFKNIGEFNAFKGALTSNGVSRLEYVGGKVQVVSTPQAQQSAPAVQVRGNKQAQRLGSYLSNPNVTAFLDAISNAEGNPKFDQGFGYRQIGSLAEHPYNGSELTPQGVSSASGAYQFMGHTWGDMKRALGLVDFSPTSQKLAALKQIEQVGILDKVASGQVGDAEVKAIAGIWASVETSRGGGQSAHAGNQVSSGGTLGGFRSFWEQRRKQGGSIDTQPSKQQQAPVTPPPPSDERIPLGNGKYMLRGKIISSAASYTNSSPLQPSYASASKHDYGVGDDTSYNYAQLKREPQLLASLETEATRAGVPAQWMADLASLHGTLGIQGPEELAKLADKLQGETIRTPQDMVRVALGDASAVAQLGIHAGRRYDSQFSRFARATAGVHREYIANCTLCAKLTAQSDFVVHKGELA
jgi:murein DD-endopeptidase MepM/ murein hydrolase activator NlpD/muramidase (phage lysozyme)